MKAAALLLLLLAGCASVPPAPSVAAPATPPAPFDQALWFVAVADAHQMLEVQNAKKLAIPASNRKLFAAVLIAECGLDSRIPTDIWLDGEDLVIEGHGDPSLGASRWERGGDFDGVAQLLVQRGVTRVRDVIADVSAFDRLTIPGSWKVGNLGRDVAAPVDAIAWGENEIPVDRAVESPGLHAAAAMREALVARGIEVGGELRLVTEPRAWREKLTTLESPILADLLTTVLQASHNLYAEMLFKRMGDGNYDRAFLAEEALMARLGIDPDDMRFVDGSGLAPDDLVTADAIIRVLRWMGEPSRRGVWWDLLAQPGGSGSLRRRLLPLADQLRGKTGSTNGVNSLACIIAMPDGTDLYASILINHHTGDGGAAIALIDEKVLEIVRARTPPSHDRTTARGDSSRDARGTSLAPSRRP